MAKKNDLYVCLSCGVEYSKWNGRCSSCGQWNTIIERKEEEHPKKRKNFGACSLDQVVRESSGRILTGNKEFDLVCGGGVVPGSVILLGGEPGIGKSTLALGISATLGALYISGEESPSQIRDRAERININLSKVTISIDNEVGEIISLAEKIKPGALIVDSIQTICNAELPGIMGSVSQVRESAARLTDFAKKSNIPVLLIGHITKDGAIAGPKLLEHIVDTVLYFEGDFSREYRVLRAFKNRYGSVNELGLFKMTSKGLEEVKDKNRIFLNSFRSPAPGNAISAAFEGTRPILFEVQALVTFSNFSNPRRLSDGFDINRLIIICAVLEKHGGLKLSNFDVFLNVSGGFNINDTAGDLAVAMAIASSLKEKVIPDGTGFIAEVSLSGELRPVSQVEKRIQEFRISGFKRVFLSEHDAAFIKGSEKNIEIIGATTIFNVIEMVF